MAHQVYVQGVFERRFGPLQGLQVERIGWRVIDQPFFYQPLLKHAVESACRHLLVFAPLHNLAAFLTITPFDLHNGAYCSFQPKTLFASKCLSSLLESLERQQMQFWRGKQEWMAVQHHAHSC